MVFLWVGADHEDRLYNALVAQTIRSDMRDEEKALALMRRAEGIVRERRAIFGESPQNGVRCVRTAVLRSGDTELLQADGACGSASSIFAESCQHAGIPARLCQLTDSLGTTRHVIAEAMVGGRWVVVDALFGRVFRDRGGRMVGCAEVAADWDYYQRQAPEYLEHGYDFRAVRYTNWSKFPVLLPLVKGGLNLVLGHDRADTVSVRSYCLNLYSTYLLLLLGMTVLLNVAIVLRAWRRSRRILPRAEPGRPAETVAALPSTSHAALPA
jgi:transglutaminase-like putative cysteine protease